MTPPWPGPPRMGESLPHCPLAGTSPGTAPAAPRTFPVAAVLGPLRFPLERRLLVPPGQICPYSDIPVSRYEINGQLARRLVTAGGSIAHVLILPSQIVRCKSRLLRRPA